MKKRLRLLFFIFVFFIALTPNIVFAECERATSIANEYNDAKSKYDKECSKLVSENKGNYQTDEYKNKKQECDNLKNKVDSLAEEARIEYDKNEDCQKTLDKIVNGVDCSGNEEIHSITNDVLRMILIIAPFLLIIFVSIDLMKIVTMSNMEDAKKAKQNIVKRVIAFLLLLLVPAIVNFITSFDIFQKDEFECSSIEMGDVKSSNQDFSSVINSGAERIKTIANILQQNCALDTNGKCTSSSTATNPYGANVSFSDSTYYAVIPTNASAATIMSTAQSYSANLKSWKYAPSRNDSLIRYNIKAQVNNPNKQHVCSTYVASVLYLSGALPEEYINKFQYQFANTQYGVEGMVQQAGWTKITSYDAMQPGDVAFTTNDFINIGHTMIYAGNDSWYTAGNTDDIKKGLVKTNYYRSRFVVAYRIPSSGNVQ